MFEITRHEEKITVHVKLKKRLLTTDKKMRITTTQVVEEIKRVHPELDFVETPEKAFVVDNRTRHLEATWCFPVQKKKQKVTKKKVTQKKVKNKNTISEILKAANTKENLTKEKDSSTVEETSQSDQPAIVQEPTE